MAIVDMAQFTLIAITYRGPERGISKASREELRGYLPMFVWYM